MENMFKKALVLSLIVVVCLVLWFSFVRYKQFHDSNIIDLDEELIISGTLTIGKDLYPGVYDLEYLGSDEEEIYLYEQENGPFETFNFTLKEPVVSNVELENGNILDLNGQDIKFYRKK